MRIAWLIFGPLEQHTGGYLYDRHAIEGLRRAGHEVILIRADPPRSDDARRAAAAAAAQVIAAARQGGLSVLVEDELCHPILPALHAELRRELGPACPLIVLLVHHLEAWEADPGSPPPSTERQALEGADAWVTTSLHSRQRLIAEHHVPAARVCAILPGADGHPQIPPVARSRQPDDPMRLLFVGHLTARKGLLDLVEALAQLERASFHLDVIGELHRDPAYAERVSQAIAAHGLGSEVALHGPLPSLRVAEYLAGADLVVAPSHYEGYGIVLAEAQFFGTPVVACRVGAVPEVVADGVSALLVLPQAPAALAAALRQLRSEPGLLDALARGARDRAQSGALSRWERVGAELAVRLEGWATPPP